MRTIHKFLTLIMLPYQILLSSILVLRRLLLLGVKASPLAEPQTSGNTRHHFGGGGGNYNRPPSVCYSCGGTMELI